MVKDMRRRDVERELIGQGCRSLRDKGGHEVWGCPHGCGRHQAPLPHHRTISPGVVRSIIKPIGVLAGRVVAVTDDATLPTEPPGTYTAEVDRENGWWTIHVLELDVVTQAARWSEVEGMARGVVIAMLDLDEDADIALELVPVFDDEAGQLLREAEDSEARARELAAFASDAKRTAVQALKAAGWTLQGIAAGIGLSYQRVEQILKGTGEHSSSADTPAAPRSSRASSSSSAAAHPAHHTEVAVPARSAKSGRYVTAGAAARSPRTTVREAAGPNRSSATAHRSATTGRYVTKSTAKRNPNGTVTENR